MKKSWWNDCLRIDSGGGSLGAINWLLGKGYQVHGKDYSGVRTTTLAESVRQWINDPADSSRQMGWVSLPAELYGRPVQLRLSSSSPISKFLKAFDIV
jgi:hypothetical protein